MADILDWHRNNSKEFKALVIWSHVLSAYAPAMRKLETLPGCVILYGLPEVSSI
jgi:hypothetical protein